MRILGHIIATAVGDLFRAIGMTILGLIIGGGAVLLYSKLFLNAWPPQILTDVVAGVIGLLAAYAGGTTVILRAIAKTVGAVSQDVEQDVKKL